jgi:hypothetical protein
MSANHHPPMAKTEFWAVWVLLGVFAACHPQRMFMSDQERRREELLSRERGKVLGEWDGPVFSFVMRGDGVWWAEQSPSTTHHIVIRKGDLLVWWRLATSPYLEYAEVAAIQLPGTSCRQGVTSTDRGHWEDRGHSGEEDWQWTGGQNVHTGFETDCSEYHETPIWPFVEKAAAD